MVAYNVHAISYSYSFLTLCHFVATQLSYSLMHASMMRLFKIDMGGDGKRYTNDGLSCTYNVSMIVTCMMTINVVAATVVLYSYH